MNSEPGPPSQPDQLVVDVHHRRTVVAMLDDLRISHGDVEQDDHLGLALLSGLVYADGEPVDVDDVLGLLRQRAAADRDGWVPVIGRNRVVDSIISEGHKPTYAANPVSVRAEEVPPVTAPANAGLGIRIGMIDTKAGRPRGVDSPAGFKSGHGTFVRSMIARQAPAADIIEDREDPFDPTTGRALSWPIAQAMMRLVREQHVHILNLSFGTFTPSGGPPLVIARAIERIASDTLVVAAAGNHGEFQAVLRGHDRRSACWPAAVPPAVAVGALLPGGGHPDWSPNLPWIDCAAPGQDVVGRYLSGFVAHPDGVEEFSGYARWSGTSFATGTVSGAIAAQISPGATPRDAREELEKLKDKGTLVKNFSVRP